MNAPSVSNQRSRQAVVIIHGIGEQQPMATLRHFVDGVLDSSSTGSPHYYSQPDLLSGNFELRCLRTPGNTRPHTDFYEFYWAHLMPKASWKVLFDWMALLLRRPVSDVPRRFRMIWWGLWISVAGVGMALLLSALHWLWPGHFPVIFKEGSTHLPLALGVLWLGIQGVLLSTIGDAATYLSPEPNNVAARHAIRTAGVELLERLHQSGDYHRIVVVGHSLGSVIGYDIIRHTWHRYCGKHGASASPSRSAMERAEHLAAAMGKNAELSQEDACKQWNDAVWEVFQELQANEHPWRISDFITLGSPLAHADLLLATNKRDLLRQFEQRELPVSPPRCDPRGRFTKEIRYELPDGNIRSCFVPHHAAWTACVRWTNLYFPSHGIFYGDAVGGPVSPLFGTGVSDRSVRTEKRKGWLAHTAYWVRADSKLTASNGSLVVLRQALGLFLHSGAGTEGIDK